MSIKEIFQADDVTLKIVWSDDEVSSHNVVSLRECCPCAICQNLRDQGKKVRAQPSVRPLEIRSVGQYALTIHFSDGHDKGIYPFSMLRQLAGLHPKPYGGC